MLGKTLQKKKGYPNGGTLKTPTMKKVVPKPIGNPILLNNPLEKWPNGTC